MKRRLTTIMVTSLCGLALSLLSAPRAHAQGQAKVVLTARAGTAVAVNVMLDSDQGTQLDDQNRKQYQEKFTGSEWSILDNGQVLISKDGKQVLGSSFFTNQEQTFFLLHRREQKLTVDGTMRRGAAAGRDANQGWAELFISFPTNDGRASETVMIVVSDLTFQQPGTPGVGGGGFGG